MADSILSNSTTVLQFSREQRQQHLELLYVGSLLSQWAKEVSCLSIGSDETHSTQALLHRLADWLQDGEQLAIRWEELLYQLAPVLDHPVLLH